jgi:hypothetical protein
MVAIPICDFDCVGSPFAGITAEKQRAGPEDLDGTVRAPHRDRDGFACSITRADQADVIAADERYVFAANRACLSHRQRDLRITDLQHAAVRTLGKSHRRGSCRLTQPQL